jgi:hypothetical protein
VMVVKDSRGTGLSVIRITHGNKAAIVVIYSICTRIPAQSFGTLSSRKLSSNISSLSGSGFRPCIV